MLRLSLALLTLLTFVPTAFAQAKPQKILFIGNSITKHAPKADIDWHGNWVKTKRQRFGWQVAGLTRHSKRAA